jgi:hypothetical protein
MTRALVAIGVSRAFTGDAIVARLPVLEGAANDAQRMAAWARGHDYDSVQTFTDADGSAVWHQTIYNWIKELLTDRSLERLLIYFAGHGYAPPSGGELLLLTNWEEDGNEAINLTASVRYAQRFSTPQISFIADACRTSFKLPTPPEGQIILPGKGRGPNPGLVDRFYATQFGDAAQELSHQEAQKNEGIFTSVLLQALAGEAEAARVKRAEGEFVTSASLKVYLHKAVPLACGRVRGAKIQYPETIDQWIDPNDVYSEWVDQSRPIDVAGIALPELLPRDPRRISASEIVTQIDRDHERREQNIAARAEEIRDASGPDLFESKMGISVVGAEILERFAIAGQDYIFDEQGAHHLGIHGDRPGVALLRIGHRIWNDHWIAAPYFPERVAIAKIDDLGYSSLNYRLSPNATYDGQVPYGTQEVEEALAEATARLTFGMAPDPARTRNLVGVLRNYKSDNPALAIIAAYLCDSIGDWGTIADMEHYDIGGGRYTPYDLTFLSGAPTLPGRTVVGSFPVLSRGWTLLPSSEFDVPKQARRLRQHMAPSLWSMAKPEGALLMQELVMIEAEVVAGA